MIRHPQLIKLSTIKKWKTRKREKANIERWEETKKRLKVLSDDDKCTKWEIFFCCILMI